MHSESRRWFYGLQQPLTDEQAEVLRGLMDEFVGQWKAHGAQLAAAYRIIGNQCLIIAVDERQQQATGCSIDKSVHSVDGIWPRVWRGLLQPHVNFYRG